MKPENTGDIELPDGEPDIYIPQPIPEGPTERLEEVGNLEYYPHTDRRIPQDELLEEVKGKDILYALGEIPYDEEVIETAEDLKLIAAMHTSATFVDHEAAAAKGVPVTGISNMIADTTAELAFALIIGTAWNLIEADEFTRAGKWSQNQSQAFLGSRIYGKTLGIVGMGDIGTLVAEKAHACGMKIQYHNRSPITDTTQGKKKEAMLGAEYQENLDDLFRECDIVSVHCGLTEETQGMIGEEQFELMDSDGFFINTSRGEVIDEEALAQALADDELRGAALDVYWNEVPEADQPGPIEEMKEQSNCIFTPHIGTGARETRVEMAHETIDAIEAFLNDERPDIVLNKEVYGEEPRDVEIIG